MNDLFGVFKDVTTAVLPVISEARQGLSAITVSRKPDDTLLTEVDSHVERLIGRVLARHAPDIPIIGEEGEIGNQRPNNQGTAWVVDPIDERLEIGRAHV